MSWSAGWPPSSSCPPAKPGLRASTKRATPSWSTSTAWSARLTTTATTATPSAGPEMTSSGTTPADPVERRSAWTGTRRTPPTPKATTAPEVLFKLLLFSSCLASALNDTCWVIHLELKCVSLPSSYKAIWRETNGQQTNGSSSEAGQEIERRYWKGGWGRSVLKDSDWEVWRN